MHKTPLIIVGVAIVAAVVGYRYTIESSGENSMSAAAGRELVNRYCVDCHNNADCHDPGNPFCSPSGRCVECLTSANCQNQQCVDFQCG